MYFVEALLRDSDGRPLIVVRAEEEIVVRASVGDLSAELVLGE